MKRLLLLLGVFVSLNCVAQTMVLESEADATPTKMRNMETLPLKSKSSVMKKSPMKVDLDSDERVMGWIDGDDYDDYYMYGMPYYGAGDRKAGTLYDLDIVEPFVGGTITRVRFALAYTIGETVVRIYPVYYVGSDMYIGDEIAADSLSSTAVGWNEVTLSTPVTIGADTTFLVSYDYYQYSSTSSYSSYPIACDGVGSGTYGFMIYNLYESYYPTYANEWVYFSTDDSGCIAIECVVQKDDYAEFDLALSDLTSDKYIGLGDDLNYSVGIKALSGTTVPDSYSISIALDGDVVETLTDPATLESGSTTTYTSTVSTDGLEGGSHTLTLYIDQINGEASTETANDTISTSFTVLSTSGQTRGKNLVEHFTSQYCTYCPYGYNVLNALSDMRGDIAWVSIHSASYSSYIDEYTVTDAKYIEGFSTAYYPSANFNRYYDDDLGSGYLAPSIGYSTSYTTAAATMFSEMIDDSNQLPSLVSLDITSTLDGTALSITISGTAMDEFADYMGDDAVITVYLTEDSLIGTQLNLGTYDYSYEHNNVLRAIVSEPLGDAINWNGLDYENTYTTTLDSDWDTDNMNIIAFISKPIIYSNGSYSTDVEDCIVNQCNKAKFGESVTGISTVKNDASSSEVIGRYTTDGRLTDGTTTGIQIIKYANGTAKKVFVK